MMSYIKGPSGFRDFHFTSCKSGD